MTHRHSFYQTIIIGGGVSGLACAKQLAEKGSNFLLICKRLGGRIETSECGKVNYGAYFFGHNYKHLRHYVDIKRRFSFWSVAFHGAKSYFVWRAFRHPIQLVRLVVKIVKFHFEFTRCQKRALNIGQKKAIEASVFLSALYQQSAFTVFHEWRFREVIQEIIEPVSRMCTLMPLTEISAFHVLHMLAHALWPVYDFSFHPERVISTFADRVMIGTVRSISRKNGYIIELSDGKILRAQSLVLATPIDVSQKLLGEEFARTPCHASIFHVQGEIKDPWKRKPIHIFQRPSDVVVIIKQADGSYLLAAESPSIDLKKYFYTHLLLKERRWQPAFHYGNTLIEPKREKNLYMIGDYNIVGLEDSFQTGLFAANQLSF